MRNPCSILLLCVLLGSGVSVVVPAEDVLETAYDEPEALPYVSTSVFSFAVPKAVVPVPAMRGVVSLLRPGSSRRLGTKRFEDGMGRAYLICDSLIILDRALRC